MNNTTYGWALCEYNKGEERINISSVRRIRAEVIDWTRENRVGASHTNDSWASLKRRYRFRLVRVEVREMRFEK